MLRFLLSLLVLATASMLTPRHVRASEETPAESPAKPMAGIYQEKIAPLLARHCYGCHGSELQRGGLRLDRREEAEKGGHSGLPVLGGTLETNELYNRVSSQDRTFWMPKGENRLSEEEIALVKQWITAGMPWPDPPMMPVPAAATPSPAEPWYWRVLDSLELGGDRFVAYRYFDHLRRYAPWMIAVLLLIVVVERCGKAYQRQGRWATGRARWFFALCNRLRMSAGQYLVALAAFLTFIYIETGHDFQRSLQAEIHTRGAALQAEIDKNVELSGRQAPQKIYGDPPIPIRPNHPKRVRGTYYRGNCERNAELFNNGHYLTARLQVGLCDAERRPLEIGDAAGPKGLTIWFEIERGPNATPTLFSEAAMTSVFLSPTVYRSGQADPEKQPHRLQTVQPGERWAVYYPIETASADDPERLTGLVYVYVGRGELHYGIQYDLRIADGKLAEGSDLWVGSLFWSPQLALPQRDKVPLDEWFDYRPIPEITGPNSTDPALLGIPEHADKAAPQSRSRSQAP